MDDQNAVNSEEEPDFGSPSEPKWEYETPDEDEIKRLASAVAGGSVFTLLHVPDEDQHMLPTIFMPLIFGALTNMGLDNEEEFAKVKPVFYEYLDKAAPRSINGYPCFFSMHVISYDDWEKLVLPRVLKIKKAMEE